MHYFLLFGKYLKYTIAHTWLGVVGVSLAAGYYIEATAQIADAVSIFAPISWELWLFANVMVFGDGFAKVLAVIRPEAPGMPYRFRAFSFKRFMDTFFKLAMYNFVFLIANAASHTAANIDGQDLGFVVDGIRLLMIGVSPAANAVFGWWEFMSAIRNVATGFPAIGALAKFLRDRLPEGLPEQERADTGGLRDAE